MPRVCVEVGLLPVSQWISDKPFVPSKLFFLDLEQVTSVSRFFSAKADWAALSDAGKDMIVQLPDEYVDVFERFVAWLQTGTFDLLASIPARDLQLLASIVEVYLFAERRVIPQLQVQIADVLAAHFSEHRNAPNLDTVALVYEQTPYGHVIRQMMVNSWLRLPLQSPQWQELQMRTWRADSIDCPEFFEDISASIRDRERARALRGYQPCVFHGHEPNEEGVCPVEPHPGFSSADQRADDFADDLS